jgi:hypothetical protein
MKLILMNEFRTGVKSLPASLLLPIAEGDLQLKVDQKGCAPVFFINKKSLFLPRLMMTTNFLKRNSRWGKEDCLALKGRFASIVHFTVPVSAIRHLTPKSFRVDKKCICCARRFASWCYEGYIANTEAGDVGASHLSSNPSYCNKVRLFFCPMA